MDLQGMDLETLLDNLDDAVWMTNRHGDIVYTNRSYQQLCKRSKEWFDTHNAFDVHEQGYTSVCPTKIVLEKKKRIHLVQHITGTDNGVSCDLLLSCTPIFDACGEVEYVVGDVIAVDRINAVYNEAMAANHCVTYSNLDRPETEEIPDDIIAYSSAMKRVLEMADNIVNVDTNVLISGESGVGKNVLAAYIHNHSRRSKKPLVEINCAAMPESLLEAELFGYERGAFTGALNSGKPGLFEEANGGSIFLDEVNSMPLSMQGKLLHAIETKTIRRIGSTKSIPVDFRLIAAANADLRECCQKGLFREDLYYRLNVASLHLIPLRERKEDIVPLCLAFLKRYCKDYNRTKVLSQKVFDKIMNYPWPGNIRELKNFVERLVVMTGKDIVYIEDVSDSLFGVQNASEEVVPTAESKITVLNLPDGHCRIQEGFSMNAYLEDCEKSLVKQTLMQCKNTYRAAELLGLSQPTVARLKKKYKIEY